MSDAFARATIAELREAMERQSDRSLYARAAYDYAIRTGSRKDEGRSYMFNSPLCAYCRTPINPDCGCGAKRPQPKETQC